MVSQKLRLPLDLSTLSTRWRELQSAGDPLDQLTLSMQRLLYQSADRPFVVTPPLPPTALPCTLTDSDAPSIESQIGNRLLMEYFVLPCRDYRATSPFSRQQSTHLIVLLYSNDDHCNCSYIPLQSHYLVLNISEWKRELFR